MFRFASKAHKPFKTKTEKTLIIGGNDDYCAERFGYKREKNGITPLPAYVKVLPQVSSSSGIGFAEYLPMIGMGIYMTGAGIIYGWDTTVKSGTKMFAMLSDNYPFLNFRIHNGNNEAIIVAGEKFVEFTREPKSSTTIMNVKLSSSVIHCGRLFGADKNDAYTLRWSDYGISTSWVEGVDKAGHLTLNTGLGKIIDMFVMNEKMIILREWGITLLSTLGDFRHMRTEVCDKYRLPFVYKHSSAICGGQLWISTKGGLFVFDGSTLTLAPFDESMKGYALTNAKVKNQRYIYFNAAKDGGNCLLEYDTQTGGCTPFAKDCAFPFFTEDEDFCFKSSVLGSLIADAEDPDRKWVSKPFGAAGGKARTLKNLTVEGSGELKVEVDCDGRKLHAVGAGRTVFNECGQIFTFKVTGNAQVTAMTAEWEVRE